MSRHLLRRREKMHMHRRVRYNPAWQHNGTWAVTGIRLVNTPTLGSETISNTEFTTNTTGVTAVNSATITRRDYSSSPNIAPTGGSDNFGLEVASSGSGSSAGRIAPTLVNNTFYQVSTRVYLPSANVAAPPIGPLQAVNPAGTIITTSLEDAWQTLTVTARATSTTGDIRLRASSSTVGDLAHFDIPSCKPLTLNQLMIVRQGSANPVSVVGTGSIMAGLYAGVVYGLDSISGPTNMILAIHDGVSTIQLLKLVSGTWTQLISTSATYTAGVLPQIKYLGSNTYQLIYNGTQRGTNQTITDAGTGTLHGAFSASPSNVITGVTVASRTYDPLTNFDDTAPVFGLIGDSVTAGNTPTSSGQINVGWWHWAQAKVGFRAFVGAWAGVGGNVTTQMAARLNTDIITPLSAYTGRAKYCVVMGGVNDSVNASDIVATATANLAQMYSDLITAGITPVAMTITPTTSADTPTKIANWDGINAWLRSYCPAHNIALCDNEADCRDMTQSGVRVWKSGYTHDGVHPTAQGAEAISKTLATWMAANLPGSRHLYPDVDKPLNFITSTPAMLGTTGSLTNGATGQVATSWGVDTGTASKLARTDDPGEWQVAAIANGVVRVNNGSSTDISTGFAVGDKVVAQAQIYCVNDWVSISQFVLFLEFRDASNPIGSDYSCLANNPNSQTIPNPAPNGIVTLRTIPVAVPVGTTIIRMYIYFTGTSGTIRVGRFELKKVS